MTLTIPDDSVVTWAIVRIPGEGAPAEILAHLRAFGVDETYAYSVKFDGRTFHLLEEMCSPSENVWESEAIDISTGEIVRLRGRAISC